MKRTRFTEEQIIGILKDAEAGAKTADLARRHGSEPEPSSRPLPDRLPTPRPC